MSARRKSVLTLVIVPVMLLLSLVAVGVANASRPSAPAKAATPTITISMFAFQVPASVPHGATVKVVNKDGVTHTVTSNKAGKFNVSIPAHSTATFKAPSGKGTFKFHCTIHPSMVGALHVS